MIFQFADDFPVRKLLVYQGHTLDHPSSLTHCWNSRRPVLGRGIPFNLHGWEIWKQSLQVRRSSLTRSLAKDQVLRGPLTFGLPRFDRAQPFFSSRSSSPSFSTLVVIAPPCAPNFLWYQSHKWRPKTIPVQCWIWLEPIWNCCCIIGKQHFFNHLQITAPNGPFQFAMKSH